MKHEQLKHLVDRFLSWHLPTDFNPDGGIGYSRPVYATREAADNHQMPTGTNLFDASQAYQMVRHMVEGMPAEQAEQAMPDKEAVDMMRRCKDEIVGLRAEIERLKPKAHAYDSVSTVLRLLPQPSAGMSEDLVWRLDKRIRELVKPESANG
ncbi:hypothetical protein [Bradyrhizobium sp.]|uniref:hypothetical protein n=1 Tax=Bradyrhizobium sp. TaxID=376 RepID=UPI0039E32D19